MPIGKAYLVGAGPGDPGLITVKGLECLRQSNVILHDRLVGEEIMRHAPKGTELIYCGKRPDHHAMTQDEINACLVEKALEGHTVCRLKGGDPIVFGRGAEEALELRKAGVPFEIVPGITSAVAAGVYAGIPVTLRGVASSFAVITGHEDPTKDEASVDWRHLATAVDTLVILMGVGGFASIAEELIAGGRDPQTPVAFVSWATHPRQRTVISTLERGTDDIEKHAIKPPAVITVGDVVQSHSELAWHENRPLSGRRVLVTRTREQASELSRLLSEKGAVAVELPVIRIVEPEDWGPFDQAVDCIDEFDWLVLTSGNGVRAVRDRLLERGLDVRALAGPRIAAIGAKTAEAIENLGIRVDVCPDRYVAEALADQLIGEGIQGKRLLVARAAEARDVLIHRGREAGAEVTVTPVYRTLPANAYEKSIIKELGEGKIDVVTFASSSTVRFFLEMLGEDRAKEALSRAKIACIGPITASTATDAGLRVDIQPEDYTIEGLVEAIVDEYRD
ncbi:MAG: uroporphyrinogen-III C-methyltransferase [Armatimonadia bacterium]|nr:uroporphyrinogen-III C-methyltransferase [Armatimonadia bacterium]